MSRDTVSWWHQGTEKGKEVFPEEVIVEADRRGREEQVRSDGMYFRTSEEFWDVLNCVWKWTRQVDVAGKQAEGSSRRLEMLCWSLRLYHNAKLMVFSCPEFWVKGPAEVLLWGRGGGWNKGDLSFRAALLWSVLVKFSLSKELKKSYFCCTHEGMHGLKTGATDHMELLEGCDRKKMRKQ